MSKEHRESKARHSGHEPTTPAAEAESTGGSAETTLPAEPETVEALQRKLDEERAKTTDYMDRWQRAMAEFANYKRRTEQEKADLAKFANSVLVLKLLPVLDDLERAIEAIPKEMLGLPWVQGILLIERKLRSVLEQEGLERIEALGKEFDPNLHDAVIYEESGESNTDKVVAEVQKGYKLHDRVLRPTMVKVGR
jgi:molecular chaperone GrpE